jgi:hypothetical protein
MAIDAALYKKMDDEFEDGLDSYMDEWAMSLNEHLQHDAKLAIEDEQGNLHGEHTGQFVAQGGSEGVAGKSKPSQRTGEKETPQGEFYLPNLTAKNSATGIVDHARVGVPAMTVPPPPKIPRLPNLSKKQRKVESRFADAYEKDPEKMARKYLKALRKRKVGVEPNIFATDDVKALNPDWNPSAIGVGEELDEDTKKAMAKYNTAVHQTANAIAKRAFLVYLDDVVAKLPEDKRRVLITNGGCAAGKGSTLASSTNPDDPHYGMLPASEQVGAIWDAAGEQNATENAWIYAECKKRGIAVTCAYVWADPKDTWEGSDRGVIRRAMRKGRMVDARLFADSYAEGAKNMSDFVKQNRYAEGLDFVFIDNRSKSEPKILSDFPDETLKWKSEDIYASAVKSLKAHEADLDPALVKGGLNGEKIWGPPKPIAG